MHRKIENIMMQQKVESLINEIYDLNEEYAQKLSKEALETAQAKQKRTGLWKERRTLKMDKYWLQREYDLLKQQMEDDKEKRAELMATMNRFFFVT